MERMPILDTKDVFYKILDGLDAYVYITDPHTHEILFINKIMEKTFGKEITGKLCWQALQSGMTQQCDFCPVKKLLLDPTSEVVWEELNTITKRYYQNTDSLVQWYDGRLVHLQHSVDITEIKLAELLRTSQYERQNLLLALSMIYAVSGEVATLTTAALKKISDYYRTSRVFVMVAEEISSELTFTYYYRQPKSAPISYVNNYHIEKNSHFYQSLITGEPMLLNSSSVDALIFDKSLGSSETYVVVPLIANNTLWGILCLEGISKQIDNHESEFSHLKLVGNILLSGIIRKEREDQLVKRDSQLVEAIKNAESANNAKTDFLSRMSHEIRTPITAIMGMSYIAKGINDVQKIHSCIEKIDSSSKHLLKIINDILDMSKIEAEKLDISYEDFDLEKMLIELCNILNIKAAEKKQVLSINIAKDISPNYVGDSMRLSQVTTNLLANAIKFSPNNSTIRLNISLDKVFDDKSVLLFEIIDHGIGIPSDKIKHLFTPFEQADGGISRKFGGTGLGLAISKKIVNLMGGNIWVESQEGKGSIFRFTVTLGNSRKNNMVQLPESISKEKLRIMAVDDSPEILEFFDGLMQSLAIETTTVSNAEDAIEMIKAAEDESRPYSVIFMDWNLPGMNGIEAAKIIKQKFTNSYIVILVSITEWSVLEKQAKEAGIEQFLAKPLFATSIIDVLRTVLKAEDAINIKSNKVDLSNKRILLTEDIDINIEIIKAMLESTGVQIQTAQNGVEAIEMYRNGSFDLILMDINLPIMDGYEATRQIRKLKMFNSASIPIIAMTANAFSEDVEKCKLAGMNDHIPKPLNENYLIQKISKYLIKDMEAMSESNDLKDFLPYVDVAEGLSRLQNNKKLYARLLKSYLASSDIASIEDLLTHNNITEALSKIHSLKGVSANLSIAQLCGICKELELTVKENRDYTKLLVSLKVSSEMSEKAIRNLLPLIEVQ